MELKDAIGKAKQLLDEERVCPSIEYKHHLANNTTTGVMLQALYTQELRRLRSVHPKPMKGGPLEYTLESVNYTLLCSLYYQVRQSERRGFLAFLAAQINALPGCREERSKGISEFQWLISELPLIAEFCVRNGGKQIFLRAIWEGTATPSHMLLLDHFEQMISLNFTIFTDTEYNDVAAALSAYLNRATAQLADYREKRITSWRIPQIGLIRADLCLSEIIAAAKGVVELCRKARYLYLKGFLLENLNLEVNQDREVVEGYLQHLGFSQPLIASLNEAERLYTESSTGFDLKSSMGHLRSFLEGLTAEALPHIPGLGGGQPGSWGLNLKLLTQSGALTKAEEDFASSLYRIISDGAVHPLIAEREYARLARNMVIEYALLFLGKLEKLAQQS